MHMLNVEQLSWAPIRAKGQVPHRRDGHSLNYYGAKNMFVLFGGSDNATDEEFSDVYTFQPDTLTWSKGVVGVNVRVAGTDFSYSPFQQAPPARHRHPAYTTRPSSSATRSTFSAASRCGACRGQSLQSPNYLLPHTRAARPLTICTSWT